jgi:MYXO-CTERM domain-containing protein
VITEDAYVDLPNGIVSAAAAGGAVSFEFWASVATTRTWQRFGDFGTSNMGENSSAEGSMAQYVLVTPNSGRFSNGLEITNHPASNTGEPNVGVNGPFPTGNQHVVAVYDHNNTSSGPNGTMTLYHNGALVGSNQIHPDVDLRSPIDNNNWLGRSQWNDPVFDGSYDEFRVYNHALDAATVSTHFQLGPNFIPEPTTIAGAALAILALAGARRPRRKSAAPRG